MLLDHPVEDASREIALMRLEIAEVLKAQQKDPVTTPQELLKFLQNCQTSVG